MAPPVKEPGQPPDVTVCLASKETDVTSVQKATTEMIAVKISYFF